MGPVEHYRKIRPHCILECGIAVAGDADDQIRGGIAGDPGVCDLGDVAEGLRRAQHAVGDERNDFRGDRIVQHGRHGQIGEPMDQLRRAERRHHAVDQRHGVFHRDAAAGDESVQGIDRRAHRGRARRLHHADADQHADELGDRQRIHCDSVVEQRDRIEIRIWGQGRGQPEAEVLADAEFLRRTAATGDAQDQHRELPVAEPGLTEPKQGSADRHAAADDELTQRVAESDLLHITGRQRRRHHTDQRPPHPGCRFGNGGDDPRENLGERDAAILVHLPELLPDDRTLCPR